MPNKKTKKQLKEEGKSQKEINAYFGVNEKTGRPIKWTEEKAMELANELIDWMKSNDNNIFFEQFLVEDKDRNPQIVSELSSKFKSFSEVIKKAKQIQEYRVANMGLMPKETTNSSIDELNKEISSQKHNSAFCMFFLKAHYGWLEEEKRLNHEIKLQELEIKKQMMELTKKQHEDDEVEHVIRFNGQRTIINP